MYTIIPQTQTRPLERVCVWVYLLQCRRLAIHDIDGSDNKDKRLKSCTKYFYPTDKLVHSTLYL